MQLDSASGKRRCCSDVADCMCRSTFGTDDEKECFQGIVDYMNNAQNASSHPHGTIKSWFYWAYNPDSEGTVHLACHLLCVLYA